MGALTFVIFMFGIIVGLLAGIVTNENKCPNCHCYECDPDFWYGDDELD